MMLLAMAFSGHTGLIAEEGPPKLKAELEKGSPGQSFHTQHPSDPFGILGSSKICGIVTRRQKSTPEYGIVC